MKTIAKRTVSALALLVLCLTLGFCALACGDNEKPPQKDPTPPVKVSDGIDFELAVGKSKNLTVADYITVNDYSPSAQSDSQNATAAVSEGLMTVTGVSEGSATVTLSCGEITVMFGVTVFIEYKVTVDGKDTYVKKGETFTLPAAPTMADANTEFDYWLVGEEHKNPGDTIPVTGNITVTSVPKPKAPVKVKDGGDVIVSVGKNKPLNIADYITAYGATVTAESDDTTKVSVAITDGKIVFTAVAEGSATVTVTCGNVEIEFTVTVTEAEGETYTVTVDGEEVAIVEDGETYTLPAAPAVTDQDFEFRGWMVDGELKQPDDVITVENDVVITSKIERKAVEKLKEGVTVNLKADGTATADFTVSQYINKHGNTVDITAQSQDVGTATAALDGDKLTITAVAVGNTTVTLTCGDATVTFTVNVSSTEDSTPEFKNGTISFDLYEKSSDSYAFEITTLEGSNFTYEYTVTPNTGVSIEGNTLTYTATAPVSNLVLNVSVKATDTTLGEKTTSFSVTVNVTDTTPVVNNSVVTDSTTHDLYDGALNINLTTNIDNTSEYVGTYKVNDVEVADPTAYTVTGDYTETEVSVALAVEATFGTKKVTYTYNLTVKDTTAYRIKNGGFDNGLDDWTLSNTDLGAVNNASKYWNEEKPFNNDDNFFNAYTVLKENDATVALGGNEGATGTLTSSMFKVGGTGWITYKLGGAKNINDVYMEVVSKDGNKAVKLPNYDWMDFELRGCVLVAYKVNLIDYCGFAKEDEVFIRITDNAASDYGLFFLDSVVTYYTQEPDNTYSVVSNYRLYNGGFEIGMYGWTLNGDIGVVTADSKYWHKGEPANNGNEYYKDGDKLFSWWTWEGNPESAQENPGHEVNRENNTGTLTSSKFVLKAGQTISFKFGGGSGNNNIYIEVVEVGADGAEDTAIAKFYNINANDGRLIQYHYTFNTTSDKTCYIRVVDNATSGWGCLAVDSFFTYGNVVTTGISATNQLTA